MDKQSAVVDKSFLQEVLKPEWSDCWSALDSEFLILFPFPLLEEIVSNLLKPESETGTIRAMSELIYSRRDLILEDTLETVFREVMTGKDELHPRGPPTEFLKRLFAIKTDSQDLRIWIKQRKNDKRESAKQWVALQKSMFGDRPGEVLALASQTDYVEWLRALFNRIIRQPESLKTYLDTIILAPFKERYKGQSASLEQSLQGITAETFQNYPSTVQFMFARLVYVTIPRVRIDGEKLMAGQQWGDQTNNFEDEQYVCSAMRFSCLITRDKGMKNVMRIVKLYGLFNGDIRYWANDAACTLKNLQVL